MMQNTKYIIAVIVVALALVAGWNFFSGQPSNVSNETDTTETAEVVLDGDGTEVVIVFKDGRYTPADVTIKQGEVVVFVNEDDISFWPATNLHPTHTGYPGSDIVKCGSEAGAGEIFDACEPLPPGSEYGFVFNEAGEWPYHDHLRPSAGGTITVVE